MTEPPGCLDRLARSPRNSCRLRPGDDIEQAMIRDGKPYPVTIEQTVPPRFRTDWVRVR